MNRRDFQEPVPHVFGKKNNLKNKKKYKIALMHTDVFVF